MKMRKLIISSLLLVTFNGNVNAAPFTIDGDLNDWGVSHNGNAADWTPDAGILYTVEDQYKNRLEPGYGGQRYDAEAIYAHKGTENLSIALATGHDPETRNNRHNYGAGDFAIDFGRDGSYEVGINIKPSWDVFGVIAGVYKVTEWAYGLWADDTTPGYVNAEHPTSIVTGDLLGLANLAISGPQTGFGAWNENHQHYFYEMSLNLDLLTAAGWQGESFNIHWTQNCGNDSIIVDPPSTVPVPSTLILLLLGFVGLSEYKKNRMI